MQLIGLSFATIVAYNFPRTNQKLPRCIQEALIDARQPREYPDEKSLVFESLFIDRLTAVRTKAGSAGTSAVPALNN